MTLFPYHLLRASFILLAAVAFSASLCAEPGADGIVSPTPIGPPERSRSRPPPPTEPSIPIPHPPEGVRPAPAARPATKATPGSEQGPPVQAGKVDPYVMLVRSTIVALQQANATGDYSVLRSLATPQLQAKVTAEDFAKSFADLRRQGADLSPALVIPPHFTERPEGLPAGAVHLAGYFPTRPLQIDFVIVYRAIDERWLIDALSVSVRPVAANATEQIPPPKKQPAKPADTASPSRADKPQPPEPSAPPVVEEVAVPLPERKPAQISAKHPAASAAAPDVEKSRNAQPVRAVAAPEPATEAAEDALAEAPPAPLPLRKSENAPAAAAKDAAEDDAGSDETIAEAPEPVEPAPPLPARKPHNAPSYVHREIISPLPLSPEEAN